MNHYVLPERVIFRFPSKIEDFSPKLIREVDTFFTLLQKGIRIFMKNSSILGFC